MLVVYSVPHIHSALVIGKGIILSLLNVVLISICVCLYLIEWFAM